MVAEFQRMVTGGKINVQQHEESISRIRQIYPLIRDQTVYILLLTLSNVFKRMKHDIMY